MDFMEATASQEQVEKFTLRAGDTIITKDSETADDIAISAYVPESLPGVICGYHLSVVRPTDEVLGRYVKRLFDSRYLKARFAVAANGLTRVGLSQYALDNVDVPVPPMGEQRAIARFIDEQSEKIDGLIAEQERLIALLKEKRQAVISHAVTKGLDPNVPMKDSGIEWLGEVPAHWKVTKVKHLTSSIGQGWSPQCEGYPVESDHDWGVLKVGCVNGGVFSPAENKRLPDSEQPIPELGLAEGDVLVSRANTRELVGSAAVVDRAYPNLMLCDKLYRLRMLPRSVMPEFLSRYLGSDRVRGQIELMATGASSSMLNIAQSTILDLCIAIPGLDEQRQIVRRMDRLLREVDDLIESSLAGIGLLREMRAAVISAAVTGKIDVRNIGILEVA